MTRTTRTVAIVAAVALALTLPACSRGGATDESTSSASPTPELGVLDQLFADIYNTDDQEQSNAQMMQVEELTADCMTEQGFEYTPVDYSQTGEMAVADTSDIGVEWGTLEFAEQYGYGLTTNPWSEEASTATSDESTFVDPNQEYLDAMSETEQTAYYAALYGDMSVAEGDSGEEVEYDWTTAGCQGAASHEIYESAPGIDEDEYTQLQDEMETMYEAITTDPRMAELDSQWAACMADAGHPGLATVADAESSINDQVNALWEDDPSADLGPDATEADMQAAQDAITASLAVLTPTEIEVAVADYTCRDKVQYTETQQEINFNLQQQFYDAHKDTLDAWRDAAVAAQG